MKNKKKFKTFYGKNITCYNNDESRAIIFQFETDRVFIDYPQKIKGYDIYPVSLKDFFDYLHEKYNLIKEFNHLIEVKRIVLD